MKEVPKGKPGKKKKEEPQDEKQEDPAENGEAKVEEVASSLTLNNRVCVCVSPKCHIHGFHPPFAGGCSRWKEG